MISKIPINLDGIRRENLDKEILGAAMIAELDAINLYEQMAGTTQNDHIIKLREGIGREEKTQVGEFQALLLIEDQEQEKELKEGKREIEELIEHEKR